MSATPSNAVNIIVSIIPIVGIVMGSVVIFFYLLWSHKQKMLMIQKELIPARQFDIETFSLLSGLLLSGIGLILSLFFLLKEGFSYSVLSGLIPLSIGFCLLIFLVLRRKLYYNE